MEQLIRITCDASTVPGLVEMLRMTKNRGYESSPWIKRTYRPEEPTTELFNDMDRILRAPPFTITRIKTMVVRGRSAKVGAVSLEQIPNISTYLANRYTANNEFISHLKSLVIVFQIVEHSEMDDNDTIKGLDGMAAYLLQDGVEMNEFAMRCMSRFTAGLSPARIAGMESLRASFRKYVEERHGMKFEPTETDLSNWLSSKGIPRGLSGRYGGALDGYNLANKYGILTLSDEGFSSWIKDQTQAGVSRFLANELIILAEIEADSVLAELGFIAAESVIYEFIGYCAAVLLL